MSADSRVIVDRLRREHVIDKARAKLLRLKRELEDAEIELELLEIGHAAPRWKVNGTEVASSQIGAPSTGIQTSTSKAAGWLENEPQVETKICIDCDPPIPKPLSEFYRVHKGSEHRQARCKACDNLKRAGKRPPGQPGPAPKSGCKLCAGIPWRVQGDKCRRCGLPFAEEKAERA